MSEVIADNYVYYRDNSGKIMFGKKGNTPTFLTLAKDGLKAFDARKPAKVLDFTDAYSLISASYTKIKQKDEHTSYLLQVNAYIIKKKCCNSSTERRKKTSHFRFLEDETACKNWMNAINGFGRGLKEVELEEIEGVERVKFVEKRRFLVIVNPMSGKGFGLKLFEKQVKPMLVEAYIEVVALVTQYAGHAAEDIRTRSDLNEINAILTIGGDGTTFEVINGLKNRPDSVNGFSCQSIPILPLPGGSGNGLTMSVLFEGGESYSLINSVMAAIKGEIKPMDLSKVTTNSGKVHFSFLSLSWGFIADLDISSEGFRCFGESRFFMAAIYKYMQNKTYVGKLSLKLDTGFAAPYTPERQIRHFQEESSTSQNKKLLETEEIVLNDGWLEIDSEFILVWVLQTSHATSSSLTGPYSRLDDGVFNVLVVEGSSNSKTRKTHPRKNKFISRWEFLNVMLSIDNGDHVKNPKVQVYMCTEYKLEPKGEKQSYLSLDGEVIEYGQIHGEIIPGAAKILVPPNKY